MPPLTPLLLIPLSSAGSDDPTGREVVDRYLAALGGTDRIGRVESLTARGRYQIEGGPGGTITLYLSRPDKLLFEVELEGIGLIAQGTDGDTAWRIHPSLGTQLLEGSDTATLQKWLARGFSLLPDPTVFSRIGPAEPAEHDGLPCLRVSLTLAATGESYDDCYDPDTGLLVGRWESLDTPDGPADMLGWSSDYQAFGDLKFATTWRHRIGDRVWSAHYETIDLDTVEDSVFQLPEAVRALKTSSDSP